MLLLLFCKIRLKCQIQSSVSLSRHCSYSVIHDLPSALEAKKRGYERQRFAGDASLYAGSELRLYLGPFKFLVPVMYGPLAFAETGRVFLDGEDSRAWHSSAGGGLWFGGIESCYSASLAFAQGFDDGRLMDDYGIYLRTGFSF